jgi:hypothetical protein
VRRTAVVSVSFVVFISMFALTMFPMAISAMVFFGFSHVLSPRFLHSLTSFVAFFFAHFVPAISQGMR